MKCGIDIIDIDRIEKSISKDYFFLNVFTDGERQYINSKPSKAATAAGIYCAKEAYVKALGTGITRDCFQTVEVFHTDAGKPYLNIPNTDLSISHTEKTATAIVIIRG